MERLVESELLQFDSIASVKFRKVFPSELILGSPTENSESNPFIPVPFKFSANETLLVSASL